MSMTTSDNSKAICQKVCATFISFWAYLTRFFYYFLVFVVIVVVIDWAPYKRYPTNEFLISDDFFEKPKFWWTTCDDRRPRVPIESLNPVKLMFVLLLTNGKSHILFPGRSYLYLKGLFTDYPPKPTTRENTLRVVTARYSWFSYVP